MGTCKYFERCEAQLCPENKASLKNGCWFADEEICRNPNYSKLQFIKTQKKIAKKSKDTKTYYTYDMLNRNFRVTTAIIGLNPDNDKDYELNKWLQSRPEITEEEQKRKADFARRVLGHKGVKKNTISKGKISEKKSKHKGKSEVVALR